MSGKNKNWEEDEIFFDEEFFEIFSRKKPMEKTASAVLRYC
jgi:hypothetical protein